MKYRRQDAKAWARAHLRGIWAATLTPFNEDSSLDLAGWRSNVRHWTRELGIAGLFVNGKQGEFYALSVAERKKIAEAAKEEGASLMVSCSDQSLDAVIELAKHAQAIGADYIVVHTPLLYFGAHTAETLYEYLTNKVADTRTYPYPVFRLDNLIFHEVVDRFDEGLRVSHDHHGVRQAQSLGEISQHGHPLG